MYVFFLNYQQETHIYDSKRGNLNFVTFFHIILFEEISEDFREQDYLLDYLDTH